MNTKVFALAVAVLFLGATGTVYAADVVAPAAPAKATGVTTKADEGKTAAKPAETAKGGVVAPVKKDEIKK